MIKRTTTIVIGLLLSQGGMSHEAGSAKTPLVTSGLSVYISYSYRDKSYLDSDSEWQIPGTLMGGEALPVEEYAALDDASADYQYALSPNHGIQLSAEAHGGHGTTEFKFTHYWYLHQWHLSDTKTARLEIGRMAGIFSNTANWHASQNAYSEASLTGDIFWGRSLVDNGVRGSYFSGPWTFGAELWQGDSWLADNGEAGDVFAKYEGNTKQLTYSINAWLLAANAEERRDSRYFGGHAHGNVVVTSSDASFNGKVRAFGLDAEVGLATGTRSQLTLTMNLAQLDQKGDLVESQRRAQLDSRYDSAQLGLNWRYSHHELAARYEHLNLDNTLSGPAAILIGSNTSLDNPNGVDPKRATVSYRYHHNENLSLRFEWVDETLGTIEQERWVAGFVVRGFFE
tara:strand:- start:2882 stop:4078 length:1197 start_codon:yes stop_codon:yes gene_type:complete